MALRTGLATGVPLSSGADRRSGVIVAKCARSPWHRRRTRLVVVAALVGRIDSSRPALRRRKRATGTPLPETRECAGKCALCWRLWPRARAALARWPEALLTRFGSACRRIATEGRCRTPQHFRSAGERRPRTNRPNGGQS